MKIIHTFKDGFKLVHVIDRVEIRKLGRQMSHCINRTYDYSNKFFFLLDSSGKPVSLGCVNNEGDLVIRNSNACPPVEDYKPRFIELLRLGIVKGCELFLARMGYYSFPDKLLDMIKAECNTQKDSFVEFNGKTYFNDNVTITLKES